MPAESYCYCGLNATASQWAAAIGINRRTMWNRPVRWRAGTMSKEYVFRELAGLSKSEVLARLEGRQVGLEALWQDLICGRVGWEARC